MLFGLNNFKFKNRNTPSRQSQREKTYTDSTNSNHFWKNEQLSLSQKKPSLCFSSQQKENVFRRPSSAIKKSNEETENKRPLSSLKRNPITGENVEVEKYVPKMKLSSMRNFQTNSDFTTIHIRKRKEGLYNDRQRTDQKEWKPCVKLVDSYFENKKNDDFNLKRGLKKILSPNYNRNPLLLNQEESSEKNYKHNFIAFKPSNSYKKLKAKEIFEMKNHLLKKETKIYHKLTDLGLFKFR
jgi:hypothetical protein